jgi:hypothetical protein
LPIMEIKKLCTKSFIKLATGDNLIRLSFFITDEEAD